MQRAICCSRVIVLHLLKRFNLKIKRLASDNRAAAVARIGMLHPAAVKALCMEDAVAAHCGAYYDSFVASFSPLPEQRLPHFSVNLLPGALGHQIFKTQIL